MDLGKMREICKPVKNPVFTLLVIMKSLAEYQLWGGIILYLVRKK
jgi:hypothetical protein